MLLRGLSRRLSRTGPAVLTVAGSLAGLVVLKRMDAARGRRSSASSSDASVSCAISPPLASITSGPLTQQTAAGNSYAQAAMWLPLLLYQCLMTTAALIKQTTSVLASRLAGLQVSHQEDTPQPCTALLCRGAQPRCALHS
jgi:hypothetical protein